MNSLQANGNGSADSVRKLTNVEQDWCTLHTFMYRSWHFEFIPCQPPHYLQYNMPVSLPCLHTMLASRPCRDLPRIIADVMHSVSGLILIFIEIPLLLRICPTSAKFDTFIRRFTTNYMRAGIYGAMSIVQWLSLIVDHNGSSLIAAAVVLLIAATFYALAGLKHQQFVGSKTLGGQGVAQMIV
jgi:succinate dehydrogenase/fumarate reductase cytochrome b subunit